MATLDNTINQILSGAARTPAGFQMAGNALERANILEEAPEQQRRLEADFRKYTLPGLASSQAARGAFSSGATQRKGEQALEQFQRGYGDIGRGQAFGLGRLGLRDIGASIPGVSF